MFKVARNKVLRRKQLDSFFKGLKSFSLLRPQKGWIKEVREALGMSMPDLASRMGTIKQRISRIEKDELTGKVTIASIEKAAHAMDCDFVYFLVPRTSLEKTIDLQAHKVAEEMINDINNSMKLEDQSLSAKNKKDAVETLKKKILSENFNTIWRET